MWFICEKSALLEQSMNVPIGFGFLEKHLQTWNRIRKSFDLILRENYTPLYKLISQKEFQFQIIPIPVGVNVAYM